MTAVDALQHALAAEHAVIWGYGIVGAHLPRAEQAAALSADRAHRARRDAAADLIAKYKATPVASAATYELPFPVIDAASARRLAVYLEEGTARAWRAVLAAASASGDRRLALAALTDAAVRGTQWRLTVPGAPSTVPFPGA